MTEQFLKTLLGLARKNAQQVRRILDLIYKEGLSSDRESWVYRQSSVSELMKLEADYASVDVLIVEFESGKFLENGIVAALRCSQDLLAELAKQVVRLSTNEPQFKLEVAKYLVEISEILAENRRLLSDEQMVSLGTEKLVSELGVS